MNEPGPSADLDPLDTAFFLDCDGTLAPIVDRPDDARVPPAVLDDLAALFDVCGGALAIVSGRSLEQLDRLFSPHLFPAAGIHGIQRRDASGTVHVPPIDGAALETARARIAGFAKAHDGIVCEAKALSVALHWRMRPDLGEDALALACEIARDLPQFRLQRGKAVAELKLGDGTKGSAIEAFMREPPFTGRTPVFAGDDVTDEEGFAAIAAMDGITIKVGAGPTSATRRVVDPGHLHRWLRAVRENWQSGSSRPHVAQHFSTHTTQPEKEFP